MVEGGFEGLAIGVVVVAPRLEDGGGDHGFGGDDTEAAILAVDDEALVAEDIDGGVEDAIVFGLGDGQRVGDFDELAGTSDKERGEGQNRDGSGDGRHGEFSVTAKRGADQGRAVRRGRGEGCDEGTDEVMGGVN